MTEINIQKHNFDKAKNNIKQFSLTKPEELSLKKVDERKGLFDWFEHKVTGEELNNLTNQLQGYLIKFNNLNSKFIQEFGEVYNALEALDKEYIDGILISVKAAEKASMEAKDAQKGIQQTIEVQKKTLKVLANFKEELEKLKHLKNIDEIWEDTQRFSKDFRLMINAIQKLEDESLAHDGVLADLVKFKTELNKQKHLNAIDTLWDDSEETKRNIESIEQTLKSHTELIENQSETISSIQKFTDDLAKIEHIFQIDEMWEDIEQSKRNSALLEKEVNVLNEKLVEMNNQMTEQNLNYENEIKLLNQKMKNGMLVGYSSLGLVIILYVLNLTGII